MSELEFEFCDHQLEPKAKPRLSRQCLRILDRLMLGPATNQELATLALKYTGRCSDLRKVRLRCQCIHQDHRTGIALYALFVNGLKVDVPS